MRRHGEVYKPFGARANKSFSVKHNGWKRGHFSGRDLGGWRPGEEAVCQPVVLVFGALGLSCRCKEGH